MDDTGTVLIIALFYSGSISCFYLIAALVFPGIVYFLLSKGYFSQYLILITGGIIWFLFLKSVFHPAIAGLTGFFILRRRKGNMPSA